MYYTGIGSRETPEEAANWIRLIAALFADVGYTLRSGGADGADTFFEQGCDLEGGTKEIYLPWKGFNKNASPLHEPPKEAFTIAESIHPRWVALRTPVRKLMARNSQQVLGKNLDTPSDFVVCWTPDGCRNGKERTKNTGGTGQAIELASSRNIPVYNAYHDIDRELVEEIIEKLRWIE